MRSSPGKDRDAGAALRHRLATISIYQDQVLAGCLMSYGQNVAEFHQRAARYVDRLKGAKPDDLPVGADQIDLIINSKRRERWVGDPAELPVSAILSCVSQSRERRNS